MEIITKKELKEKILTLINGAEFIKRAENDTIMHLWPGYHINSFTRIKIFYQGSGYSSEIFFKDEIIGELEHLETLEIKNLIVEKNRLYLKNKNNENLKSFMET